MELHPLPPAEAAVHRYVTELWLPYHRELEVTVDAHALADDVDIVAAETRFRVERLEEDDYRAWVAVDGEPDGNDPGEWWRDDAPSGSEAVELVGFVTTEVEAAPTVFDRPDRLLVGDLFVREAYRGTALARKLMERATERARDAGCEEVVLDVDVDNERAIAFYEKRGFETYRRRMRKRVDR